MHAQESSAESSEARLKREVVSEASAALEGRPVRSSGTFFKQSVTRELVNLAWPIAAAMLGETAIGLVDTKLVGGLGPAALGGVGLATMTMFLCYALVFGLMRGVKVRASHAIGEGRAQNGVVYAMSGLLMGLTVGVGVLFLCRDVRGLLTFVGSDPSIVPYASEFLAAVTLGAPATCALAALIQHRQAVGDSRTPMIVGLLGNAFNACLAYGLIYGHFGLPALGVRGGGYSTALTETLELVAMLFVLARDYRRAPTTEKSQRISLRQAAIEIGEIGLPTGLQFGAETLAFATFTAVLGGIDPREIAAHQIALNVIRVSFLPGLAVAEAASVLVGRSLGARNLGDADAVVRSALGIAVGFMAACGVFFALCGGAIARFFSNDDSVAHTTRSLLLVAALFQVLDAINIVLRVALRGAKDVRVTAFLSIVIVWTCVPTSAYLLGRHLGLGAMGGWIGFIGETTIGALIFWPRWKRGAWRAKYVNDTK